MIHQIRIKNVNTKEQKKIEKLLKQNKTIYKNLNITKVA